MFSKTTIRTALSLLSLFAATAHADPSISLQGSLALWERPVCQTTCKPPEPNGVFWDLGLELTAPQAPDKPGVTVRELKNGPWTVKLSFFWVRAQNETVKDYVVTQTQLSHTTLGLVAECSRYDSPENVSPFPVGACAGTSGNTQIGVTLMRNPAPPAQP